jgi:hypothetical protein
MVFETKNMENWYRQQVFRKIYGHLAVLGRPDTDRPPNIRTVRTIYGQVGALSTIRYLGLDMVLSY